MSSSKEPHFFSRDEVYARGSAWHDALFDRDGDGGGDALVFGESSTSYCYDETALRRIREGLGSPQLIILMREPMERLLSHYRWLWALGLEKRPLARAVVEEERNGYTIARSVRGTGNYATYLRGSRYATYVPLMRRMFGDENVLCLDSARLSADPTGALCECFAFLSLDDFVVTRAVAENRTSDKVVQRTLGLGEVARRFPWLVEAVDPSGALRDRVRGMLGHRALKPPVIPDTDIAHVRALLEEDVEFFSTTFRAS